MPSVTRTNAEKLPRPHEGMVRLMILAILWLVPTQSLGAEKWVLTYARQYGAYITGGVAGQTEVFTHWENGVPAVIGITNRYNLGTAIFGQTNSYGNLRMIFNEGVNPYDFRVYDPSTPSDQGPDFYWRPPLPEAPAYNFEVHFRKFAAAENITAYPTTPVYTYDLVNGFNTATAEAPGRYSDLFSLTTWTGFHAQTFVVPAGINRIIMAKAFIVGANHYVISASIHQGGPYGTQVGPTAQSREVVPDEFKAFVIPWGLNDVPVVPGNTYAIRFSVPFGANAYATNQNNYPHGHLWQGDQEVTSRDLVAVVIGVGVGNVPTPPPATPTPTPTITPTPIQQANLLVNGNMESGQVGTSGQTPDNWTKWTASGSAAFWYGDYGRNGSRAPQIVGGAINGTTFNAGLYQHVTGLTPGRQYALAGFAQVVPALTSGYDCKVGYDLTGQTSNGMAGTVQYTTVGGSMQYAAFPPISFTATGNAVSIWLRGHNTSTAATFYVNFDDLVLYDLGGPAVTATPTPTRTVAAPDTDGDLLIDALEYTSPSTGQTHAWLDDSDGDGLKDGQEDANRNGIRDAGETSPVNRDSDGDDWIDGLDIDPLSNAIPGQATDNDNDNLPSLLDPNDNNPDVDGDRYRDGYEAVKLNAGAVTDPNQRPHLGDVNIDGFVTSLDALVVQSLFLSLTGPEASIFHPGGILVGGYIYSDVNRDGYITSLDALVIQSNFLQILTLLPL